MKEIHCKNGEYRMKRYFFPYGHGDDSDKNNIYTYNNMKKVVMNLQEDNASESVFTKVDKRR